MKDIEKELMLRLRQFSFTIQRKVPLPEFIKLVNRETLEDYKDVEGAERAPDGRMLLTKSVMERVIEDHKELEGFGLVNNFKKAEYDIARK